MGDIKGIKILIVEDEIPLLDSYAEILEGEGAITLKASDGHKALEILEKEKDNITLIYLDLMMSGMDGLEVLRNIRKDSAKYGNPKVIVLTNMTSERVIKEAFVIGATSYLIKSELEADDLINEGKKVLD